MAYWRIYVVMFRRKRAEDFAPIRNLSNDIIAYQERAEAMAMMVNYRAIYGKGNAYIQKCGAIS